MATTRRRVTRGRSAGLSPQIRALFEIGCGWTSYGTDTVRELWNQHGPQFLRTQSPDDGKCFAEMAFGEPEPDKSED